MLRVTCCRERHPDFHDPRLQHTGVKPFAYSNDPFADILNQTKGRPTCGDVRAVVLLAASVSLPCRRRRRLAHWFNVDCVVEQVVLRPAADVAPHDIPAIATSVSVTSERLVIRRLISRVIIIMSVTAPCNQPSIHPGYGNQYSMYPFPDPSIEIAAALVR